MDKAGEGTESGGDGAEGELREGCKSESETRYHEPELDDLRTEAIQFIAAVITRLARAGLQLGRVAAREGAKEGQMVARRWPEENIHNVRERETFNVFVKVDKHAREHTGTFYAKLRCIQRSP